MIVVLRDADSARAWRDRLTRAGAEVKVTAPLRAPLGGGTALHVAHAPPELWDELESDEAVIDAYREQPEAKLARAPGLAPIDLGRGVTCGGGSALVLAAGPCAIEDEATLERIAERLVASGVHVLRGGAYKPRTSPHSFRGLGARGLEILARVARRFDLVSVTEVLAVEDVARVAEHADVIQIGARNMQAFPLLEAVGRAGKPVLLKRHPGATYDEWLLAAEWVVSAGERRVILCERGVRTFTPARRATLDLGALAWAREETSLPVAVDPSHVAGCSRHVPLYAKAAAAAGADLLLVEVHEDPARSRSDAAQALDLDAFASLARELSHFSSAGVRS